ncbi:MAG: trypsin-like peptidase domain-containing protein, partial [Phycisphaerae bacterium]
GWSRPEADDAFDPGIRLVRTGYRKVLPLVEHVRRGSPAERAGVRRDDLILLLNGRNVRDAQAYYKRLRTLSPDEPIDIVLRRGRTVLKLRLREARSRAVVAPSPNGEADELERRVPGDVASDKPSMPSGSESLHLLHATQEEFRLVVERLQPSIVRIDTVGGSYPTGGVAASSDDAADVRPGGPFRDSLGSSFVPAEGATTGIIYSSDGYIITSSLGFVRRPLLITVTLPDGRRLAAEQIARDQVRKIALLKVEASGLSVPQWSEYERLRVGQWAIALGRAFDTAGPSVTVGIVSALNRMSGNAVQTDAKLSPANYGGPLCDISGRVIGICVPMAQRPGELAGIEMYDSGVGFAVPIRRVNEIVETLKTGRSIYRGWLGISVRQHPLDGVVITEVALPSPMHDAGVHPGDILIAAEGKEIQSFDHLMKTLYMIPAGQQVELQLSRAGGEFSVAVTLARASELGSFPDPSHVRQPADE